MTIDLHKVHNHATFCSESDYDQYDQCSSLVLECSNVQSGKKDIHNSCVSLFPRKQKLTTSIPKHNGKCHFNYCFIGS